MSHTVLPTLCEVYLLTELGSILFYTIAIEVSIRMFYVAIIVVAAELLTAQTYG